MITPDNIKNKIINNYKNIINDFRNTINNILSRKDKRLLIIIGPCSVHNSKEVIEYAKLLNNIQELYNDKIFLVMRVYGEKPRSTGIWSGFINDPLLDGSNDIELGLIEYRKLCLQISELNIPIAVEMLCPITFNYFDDLVSFCSIGARTSESQIHRNFLSNLNLPCGIKNDMKGDIEVAVQGLSMIKKKHIFLNIDNYGKVKKFISEGNNNSVIILRGSSINGPNYDYKSIELANNLLNKYQLKKYILVDASHGNSNKDFKKQNNVIMDILKQKKDSNGTIIGLMIESFINQGKQNISDNLEYGVSITDGCLGWDETKKNIDLIYNNI